MKRYLSPILVPVLAGFLGVAAPQGAVADGGIAQPDGYRMEHYRAPVPDGLAGARTVNADEAAALIKAGAVAIDVIPLTLGTLGEMKDRWVVPADRETIQGAIWLPNVGYGTLDARIGGWYRGWLERLQAAHPGAPLIFFCRPDCWMSWNAGKRALEWGFGPVVWFPGGTEAWRDSHYPTEIGKPEPLQ